MDDQRHKCEHLERAPRRLSAEREAYLRDYPRHYDAGDTVHELLSEVDFLRSETARLTSERDSAKAESARWVARVKEVERRADEAVLVIKGARVKFVGDGE